MRRMLVAAILLAGAACSDNGDTSDAADEAVGETAPVESEGADMADDGATDQVGTREVISGTVSGIALDMDPPIGDMTTDDGRTVAFEIPAQNVKAVVDAWGGVGTDLRLDCETGEPFTGEGGTSYEYFQDCRLP